MHMTCSFFSLYRHKICILNFVFGCASFSKGYRKKAGFLSEEVSFTGLWLAGTSILPLPKKQKSEAEKLLLFCHRDSFSAEKATTS